MICPIPGLYKVEKYLFIGMIVRNRNNSSTEIVTTVAFFWEMVKTRQYPAKESIIIRSENIIFLSVGSILSYLNAWMRPYVLFHSS
jgi:hypothetical protein